VPGGDAALAPELTRAISQLTAIHDALRRPPPAMGYRQKPELREEINSLTGAISRAASPPTEPQKFRAGELRQETAQATARFNTFIAEAIGAINRRLGGAPRIITGRPIS
jgi:hypothetical protein